MDRAVSAIATVVRASGVATPSRLVLGPIEQTARERVLGGALQHARALGEGLARGESEAKDALARLATTALAGMRTEVGREARRHGLVAIAAQAIDAAWADCDTTEHLDDAHFPRDARVRVLEHLDAFNVQSGGYRAFAEALEPFFAKERPTRILDLAAGHGGFMLELARIARKERWPLELVATDLLDEYLELGRAVAAREGLPVRFVVQDALDLSAIAPGAYDLVVCTQALHHFPPGLVAVMCSEAARIAGRAVVLVDGSRSRTHGAVVPALGLLRYGDPAFAHDAFVSLRRFFTPDELGLIAQLGAPPSARVSSRLLPPGHVIATLEINARQSY